MTGTQGFSSRIRSGVHECGLAKHSGCIRLWVMRRFASMVGVRMRVRVGSAKHVKTVSALCTMAAATPPRI